MGDLNRQQEEAAERVAGLAREGARVVALEMASGFGRLQTLAHLAGGAIPGARALLVVGRAWLLDRALEALAERAPGRTAGLLGSGADVEVVTLRRALQAASAGRIGQDVLVVDGGDPSQAADAKALAEACPEAFVVMQVEPGEDLGHDPETFSFPVRVVEARAPDAPAPGRSP